MTDERRVEAEVEIANEMGLHTRPAKEFVVTAGRFRAHVEVSKGDQTVNGKSIMGLMSLLAPRGTHLTVVAVGEDAREAVEALVLLVNKQFGEVE
ncbi:MAG: HPr family phosphocarrier protein [bacterium]